MASRKITTLLLTICVAAVLAAACGDGDDGDETPTTTVAQPTSQPSATSLPDEPLPTAGLTGIPELDAVIEALRSRDAEALRPLIAYSQVTCDPAGQVISGLPECRPGEQDGQLVEVFRYTACEGQYLRPDEIDEALSILAGTALYAVFESPQDQVYDSEYVAVVSDQSPDRTNLGWQVEITGGRIVAFRFSCATTPEDLIGAQGLTDPLLAP